jgi:hypothetical protein
MKAACRANAEFGNARRASVGWRLRCFATRLLPLTRRNTGENAESCSHVRRARHRKPQPGDESGRRATRCLRLSHTWVRAPWRPARGIALLVDLLHEESTGSHVHGGRRLIRGCQRQSGRAGRDSRLGQDCQGTSAGEALTGWNRLHFATLGLRLGATNVQTPFSQNDERKVVDLNRRPSATRTRTRPVERGAPRSSARSWSARRWAGIARHRPNGSSKPHSRRCRGRHDFRVRCPNSSGICRFRPGLLSLSLRLLVECKEPDSRLPSCHRPTRRDKGHRASREYSVPMDLREQIGGAGNDDGRGQVRRVWRVRVPDHSYSIIGEQMPLTS